MKYVGDGLTGLLGRVQDLHLSLVVQIDYRQPRCSTGVVIAKSINDKAMPFAGIEYALIEK